MLCLSASVDAQHKIIFVGEIYLIRLFFKQRSCNWKPCEFKVLSAASDRTLIAG